MSQDFRYRLADKLSQLQKDRPEAIEAASQIIEMLKDPDNLKEVITPDILGTIFPQSEWAEVSAGIAEQFADRCCFEAERFKKMADETPRKLFGPKPDRTMEFFYKGGMHQLQLVAAHIRSSCPPVPPDRFYTVKYPSPES